MRSLTMMLTTICALTLAACDNGSDPARADGSSAAGTDSGATAPRPDGSSTPAIDAAAPANATCDPNVDKGACGGALTGTWKYVKACGTSEVIAPITRVCAGATVSDVKVVSKNGGNLVFTGKSYTLNAVSDVSYKARLPRSCAPIACAAIGPAVTAGLTTAGGAKNASVNCTDAGTACACSVAYTLNVASFGSFTTAGGVATLNDGTQYHYCLASGVLRYKAKKAADQGISYALTR